MLTRAVPEPTASLSPSRLIQNLLTDNYLEIECIGTTLATSDLTLVGEITE